jgi:cell division septum initiation protein DivIVA
VTKYRLADVELNEISLVDVGANQHAKIAIWKRASMNEKYEAMTAAQKGRMKKFMDEGMDEAAAYKACMSETKKGERTVTSEELTKKLEELQAQVTDLTKRAEGAETAVAALTKAADEAGFDVQDGKLAKRAADEFVEIGGEKIAKSAVPAPVLKALEVQAADIAKMKADARNIELAKRGDAELPNLAGTALAKGRLLDIIGNDEALLKSLKAADTALAKAAQEIGSSAIDEASAGFRLNKMATDYSVAKGVAFESAYAEITKAGEGLKLLLEARREAN